MAADFKKLYLRTDWPDRIQQWLAVLLQLAIFALLATALFKGKWFLAFTAAIVLALTFLPALIEHQLGVLLPVEFSFFTCLILYGSFGLGEVQGFYQKFWWWDLLLHSSSAFVMGMIGFLLVYVFYMTQRIRMAPFYVALVSFCFAVTLGTIWEIVEFCLDWGFGFNMQKSGINDTMTDLMVDGLGALLAAWLGYNYVKDGDSLVADRLVRRFVEKNPRLFKLTWFGRLR
ncbi:MAG: hypothetical protein OEY01_13755 [Desulfobulbaceae bacterium]|nr:hypothetical protein [Desulfobulbaceae bacterium]